MSHDKVGIPEFIDTGFQKNFEKYYAPRLAHRANTMRTVFTSLGKKRALIVETGCLRDIGNWAGDGQSTFLFDRYVSEYGGTTWSVDISLDSLSAARKVVGPKTNTVLGDSVPFLFSFPYQIDLLYLDSFDLDINKPLEAATHHLFEFASASSNLTPGSIVVVDDTYRDSTGKLAGKGMVVASYMEKIGVPILCEGYQTVWKIV